VGKNIVAEKLDGWHYRYLLVKRDKPDGGFTMPAVLGMGLLISMVVAASLTRSEADREITRARSRAQVATNVAESGAARVRSILQRRRFLANLPPESWLSELRRREEIARSCKDEKFVENYDRDLSHAAGLAAKEWLPLNPPTGAEIPPPINRLAYRLEEYRYDRSANVVTATIAGKSEKPDGSKVGSDRLEIQFPLTVAPPPSAPPTLWVTELPDTNFLIAGDIRLVACEPLPTTETLSPSPSVSPNANHTTIEPYTAIPPTESIAAFGNARDFRNLAGKTNAIAIDDRPFQITLPRPGDRTADGVYYYRLTADERQTIITIPTGSQLKIDNPSNQIVFLVEKNLNLNDLQLLLKDSTPRPPIVHFYATPTVSQIEFSHSIRLAAFLHATNATVTVKNTPGVIGSWQGGIWAKKFQVESPLPVFPLQGTLSWSNLPFSIDSQPDRQLGRISVWQKRSS
jgi:hypothetical protein